MRTTVVQSVVVARRTAAEPIIVDNEEIDACATDDAGRAQSSARSGALARSTDGSSVDVDVTHWCRTGNAAATVADNGAASQQANGGVCGVESTRLSIKSETRSRHDAASADDQSHFR